MNEANKQVLVERLQGCHHVPSNSMPNSTNAFNMYVNNFDCGSPGCIAGHCASLLGRKEVTGYEDIADWLDISPDFANDIHRGYWSRKLLKNITPQEAINFLENNI